MRMVMTVLAVSIAACTPAQKKPLVATAMDNAETRHESLEATMRVLDEHPEYVDELFYMSQGHPMFDRLLEDTAKNLANEALARRAAEHMANHPDGLRMILIATLDEVKDRPKPLEAGASAMEARPDEAVRMLVQRDIAVRRMMRALIAEVNRNPKAEQAFLTALRENSDGMAQVLTRNPDDMGVLLKAVGKSGVRRGGREFEVFLSRLGD